MMQARARVCRNGYDAPSWAIVSGSGGARRPPLLDAARNPSQLLLVQSPYGRRGATSPPLPLRIISPVTAAAVGCPTCATTTGSLAPPPTISDAGPRALLHGILADMNLDAPISDDRLVEVVGNGLPCDAAPSRLALDATIVSLLTRRASFFSPWQCPEEIREAICKTDNMRRTSHSQERAAARKFEQMRIYVHACECVCVCA